MKIAIQYLNDSNGKTSAVQLPFTDWERLLNTIKKYEHTLKIKSDLAEAFDEIKRMQKGKIKIGVWEKATNFFILEKTGGQASQKYVI